MDNEKTEVVADSDNKGGGEPAVETIAIPKSEYDKMVQEHGSFKRELKDLKKPKATEEKTESKSSDLGEKAYLAVNGIKSPEEVEFFKNMKKETGKDAESLLSSTYFQAEFREFKEKKASADATPTGSKRSNNSQVDTVDYWLAKDELPPTSEPELRRKVVNARIQKEQNKGVFHNS